jgi:hypothetical protein
MLWLSWSRCKHARRAEPSGTLQSSVDEIDDQTYDDAMWIAQHGAASTADLSTLQAHECVYTSSPWEIVFSCITWQCGWYEWDLCSDQEITVSTVTAADYSLLVTSSCVKSYLCPDYANAFTLSGTHVAVVHCMANS